jgi:hypothetical protein
MRTDCGYPTPICHRQIPPHWNVECGIKDPCLSFCIPHSTFVVGRGLRVSLSSILPFGRKGEVGYDRS